MIYGVGDGGDCPGCDGKIDTMRHHEQDDPYGNWCVTCGREWSAEWLTADGRARYKRWIAAGGWKAPREAQRRALA